MSLISIYDLDDFKINKSPYVLQAIKELKMEKKSTQENFEDVIDFGEFILKMYELTNRKKERE